MYQCFPILRLPFVLLILPFALLPSPAIAQKINVSNYVDKIHLSNGDTITGNMRELQTGKLRVKTLTMDDVYINWVNVVAIDSSKYVRIEQTNGRFANGVLAKSTQDGSLTIVANGRDVDVEIASVSNMQPIRAQESFWRRIEGDAKVGVDYKSASDLLLVNLAANFRFREEKYETAVTASWNETSRAEDEDNNMSRADLGASYTRFLKKRWFWTGLAGVEQNEELGIDVRALFGGTAGRYLVQNQTLQWEISGGLVGNLEQRADSTEVESAEALLRTSLDIFKHSLPVTRLTGSINVFPGLSESGRLRVNTNINLRNEILQSVYWDLTFYSNYDNQPAEGASEEDYGLITSIGASF